MYEVIAFVAMIIFLKISGLMEPSYNLLKHFVDRRNVRVHSSEKLKQLMASIDSSIKTCDIT